MPFILGASSAADTVHSISQSIRFNDGDSAFMKRDYSGDGSQTTFTLSGWFKLGDLSGTGSLSYRSFVKSCWRQQTCRKNRSRALRIGAWRRASPHKLTMNRWA